MAQFPKWECCVQVVQAVYILVAIRRVTVCKEVGSSSLLVHSASRDMWVAQRTDSVLRLLFLLQNLRGGGAATYLMRLLGKKEDYISRLAFKAPFPPFKLGLWYKWHRLRQHECISLVKVKGLIVNCKFHSDILMSQTDRVWECQLCLQHHQGQSHPRSYQFKYLSIHLQ